MSDEQKANEKVENEIFGEENSEETTQKPEQLVEQTEEWKTVAGGEKQQEQPTEEPAPEQQEDVEAIKKRAAFNQTNFQTALDRLKQVDPNFNEFKESLKEQRTAPEPKIEAQKPVTESETTGRYIGDMTEAQLTDLLTNTTKKAAAQSYQEAQVQAQFQTEWNTSRQVLRDFITDEKVSEEDFQQASNYAYSLGLNEKTPGGPSAITRVIVKELQNMGFQKHFNGKVTSAQAEVTDKIKQAQLLQQPDGSVAPEQGEMTEDEKILKSMRDVGKSKASSEVFGK